MQKLIAEIRASNFNEPIGLPLLVDVWRVTLINLICLARRAKYWLLQGGSAGQVMFYPNKPRPWYDSWNILTWLNLDAKIGATGDVIFIFQDQTQLDFKPSDLPASPIMINARCTDVRKSTVAKIFNEVCGYSLSVNPQTHEGEMVEKSEENGVHNGRIITGPVPAAKVGHVYQKLIDNTRPDGTIEDLRAIIVGREIVHVYRKIRPTAERFANFNIQVSWCPAAEVFTSTEQQQILTIAEKIGLDYGGIDVLRDNADGRIYVVDVNKTTMGIPIKLPLRDKITCINNKAEAFERQFLYQHAAAKAA